MQPSIRINNLTRDEPGQTRGKNLDGMRNLFRFTKTPGQISGELRAARRCSKTIGDLTLAGTTALDVTVFPATA
jgi:hypothetical protein